MSLAKQAASEARRASGRRVLPPRGLQLSLLVQAPGIVLTWPPHPPLSALVGAGFLVLTAVWLNLTAIREFSKRGAGIVPFSEVRALALAGPYRFTRNPMYVGLIAVSAAPAVGTGVWWNLAAALGYGIWLHFSFVLPEEAFLRSKFGSEFEAYAGRTHRWLGWPRR